MKSNKGILGLLIVFITLTVLLSGFIIYDKMNQKEPTIIKIENKSTIKESEKEVKIKDQTITIGDATDFTESYYKLFRVNLPRIEGSTSKNVSLFNKKMLDEILPLTYKNVIAYSEESGEDEANRLVDYTWLMTNNIVAIYISSSTNLNSSSINKNYFFDLANDTELKMSDAAKKMGIKISSNIGNYNNLNNGCYYMIINGDNVTIKNIPEC